MNEHLTIYLPAAIAVGLLAYFFLRRGAWLNAVPNAGSELKRFGEFVRLRDIFRAAILIEEEGYSFYMRMAKKARDEKTKELCESLAEEETHHRQLFSELLNHWNPLGVNPLTWPTFIETVKKEGFFGNPPSENASEEEMAAYAIKQEIKSAQFYQMFETAFPEAWKRVRLHRLVLEERSHEARLRAAYPQFK